MLTPTFMARHTVFRDIDTFFGTGGFSVKSRADLEAIPETQLDEWERRNPKFASWKQMLKDAGARWAAGELGLR